MKKKLTFLLVPLFLLCSGCSDVQGSAPAAKESKAESVTETDASPAHYNVSTSETYTTMEAFLASEFCQNMKEEGDTLYMPDYDEARFTFEAVSTAGSCHELELTDTETNSSVIISINHNAYHEKVSDFAINKITTAGDIVTTAEKDGTTYDVYIHKDAYAETDRYSLSYIPFPGYSVYILSERSTPEAVLEDFQAFTLITQEEWENAH